MKNFPNLENYWMPFTANQLFKANPRMLVKSSGMYLLGNKTSSPSSFLKNRPGSVSLSITSLWYSPMLSILKNFRQSYGIVMTIVIVLLPIKKPLLKNK